MLHSRGGYVDPLTYDFSKDQWSALPALPYSHFSLVTVPDRKQLLAIGGVMSNNGVDKFSNKVSYGMRRIGSGLLHILTCLLHDISVQAYHMGLL